MIIGILRICRLTAGKNGYMPVFAMSEAFSAIFSPCHCAVLRKAARHVSQLYDAALSAAGLKTTQFSLLAEINRRTSRPPTMHEVARAMVMDRSTLGHNLRPLEREGFITLRPSEQDRRSRHVQITEKGKSKLEEAAVLWRGVQARFESAFGAQPTADLRHALLTLATTDFSPESRN